MKKTGKISKEMNISEVISQHPKTATIFLRYCFHCVGCPGANYESIEQAAKIHCIGLNKLISELNEVVKNEK